MPDKKRTIEEQNLTNLLSAALKAPVAAKAVEQRKLRRPRWTPFPRSVLEGLRAIKPAYRFVAAAAMVVLIVVLLSWRTPSGRGSGLAFADVIDRLQEVRTVRYNRTCRRVGEPQADTTATVMEILPGRKMRFESADQTTIFNSDVRRSLCLSHTSKKAYPSDESDWPAGRQLGSSIPGSSFDEAKEGLLKRLTWGTVGEQVTQEELGEQFVEGKRASGFRIDRTSIVNQEVRAHEVWTVWADAETGLLLRMDCVTDWPRGRMEETWSDFRFNNDFDDALFSVEPPAGYEVVTLEMLCLDPEYAKGVCDSNLLQIGMAITAYMHNHDLQYPDSLEELKPILQWPKAFICPGPGSGEQGYIYDKPVTPFPRDLNFATLRSVMIVYDKPGNHEGGRNVLFLDGHVQWLSEEEFKKQWAEQHVHPAAEHAPPAQEGQTP